MKKCLTKKKKQLKKGQNRRKSLKNSENKAIIKGPQKHTKKSENATKKQRQLTNKQNPEKATEQGLKQAKKG